MSDSTTLHLPTASSAMVDSSKLFPDDRRALEKAVMALEHTNFATRLATLVGRQLGSFGRLLPLGMSGFVNRAAEKAISGALAVALGSLRRETKRPRHARLLHRAMAAASGATGGFFGLSSLPVELPVSTIIILRTIADIAREEGEDLSDPEVALACLQVFALGAHEEGDDFTDSGYFATRGLLAKTVSEAGRYALERGVGDKATPAMVRLVTQIGARFGLVVSEKIAVQAVPIIGAAGGAAVNYAFADHFQSLAFGHFTVRRLERLYGSELIQVEYKRLLDSSTPAAA